MIRIALFAATVMAPLAAGAAPLPRVITPDGPQDAAAAPVAALAAALPALKLPQLGQARTLAPPGPGLRPVLLKQVQDEAARLGVPPDLADAVAVVETGYTPQAIGRSGEIGLMQVMPSTAAGLGFQGSLDQLADPATNIHYGVSYLAKAWAASGGNPCRALMKYRAGVGEDGYSPLSLQYCRHAATWLATAQSALAQAVADTTPAVANISDGPGGGGGFAAGDVDLHELPAIAGIANMVVERGNVSASLHASHARAGVDLARVQAALDSAIGGDGHVVEMPGPAE